MSIRLSAGGDGSSPFASSWARMNRSSGDWTQSVRRTVGTTGSAGGWNDQKNISSGENEGPVACFVSCCCAVDRMAAAAAVSESTSHRNWGALETKAVY